jgi:inorganic triphosphatase YgiF
LEAALDIGDVKAGNRVMPICELELEHKSGDSRELFALAKAWLDHGGLWLNTLSKSRRGSVLANGHDHGPPFKAETPKCDRAMDGETMLRTILQSVLRQVLGNASELSSGSTSDEHVHQMRVGLRRLRTALREFSAAASATTASRRDSTGPSPATVASSRASDFGQAFASWW